MSKRCAKGSRRNKLSGRCERRSECSRLSYSNCDTRKCVPVNRKSGPYCRKRPLRSDKRKAGERILSGWRKYQQCNTFSLEQRNGTCYMAAATLMFARTALHDCSSETIRRYVRLSMANAWSDAQGDESTCPRIPLRIRQHYSDLMKNLVLNKVDMVPFTRSDLTRDLAYDDIDLLTKGGQAWKFLTALFTASNINIKVVSGIFSFHSSMTELKTPTVFAHKTLFFAANVIIDRLKDHEYFLLNFRLRAFKTEFIEGAHNFVNHVTEQSFKRGLRVKGIGVDLSRRSGGGHVITGYPCQSSSRPNWTMCNSWGDDCSREGFTPFLQALCHKRNYDHISGIYFLIRPF